jgi:GWxTD domain-containing protein
MALLLIVPGCSWFSLNEHELASELATARAAIDAGDPESTLFRLEQLAWRRRESVAVRRLLVEACRAVNTIESRRMAETALRELVFLEPDNSDVRFELAEILLARGFDLDATRQLQRVIERDPHHARAHLALGYYHEALYRRFKEPQALAEMLGYFARAADLDPDLYEAHMKRVEAFMLDGQWESSLFELERLVERWPEEEWLHALTGACLARPGTYAEAAEAFERAFQRMSRVERAPFENLRLIENPYSWNHYDQLAPDEREDYLRIFWRSKDPQPVTRVVEREVEHWRRVVMADLLYAHRRMGVRGWDTARGEMYIRYGPAIHEEYMTRTGSLLFSAPGWYHVYRVNGQRLGVTFFDTVLNGLFYFPFATNPADLAAYTMPESYEHKFGGRWLDPAVEVARFAAPGPHTRAEVYLAVPVDSLATYSGSSLEVGTVIFDREWNERARREEVLDLDQVPIAGEAGRVLVHEVNLDLEPGEYIVAAQVEGEAGAVVGTLTREIEVESFEGAALQISTPELAFAVAREPSGPESFRKGELSVVPNATGEVKGSELLVLYFEIYNLTMLEGRSRYGIRYRITPAEKKERSVFARFGDAFRTRTFIESQLIEESPETTVRRHLTIDLSALPAARYGIELEVTDLETSTTAARRIEFERTTGLR